MGKKNQIKSNNDDFAEAMDQKDDSKKFQSLRQLAKKEAAEADQGRTSGANQGYSDSDDEAAKEKKAKKEKKRKNKGGQQTNEFQADDDEEENKEAVPQETKKKADSDQEQDEDAIQKQLEENFEGIGKKNTRKHKKGKNKEDIFAEGTEKQADLMAAFDDGADSDEMYARKGGKQNKKDKQQGKHKKNKKKEQSEDEEEQPEAANEEAKVTEEVKEEAPAGFALDVVYCKKCGCPPEYCAFVEKKDTEECKEWLRNNHPDLYSEIYDEVVDKSKSVPDAVEGEGDDEEKKEGEEGEEKKPKKKGVKFAKDPAKEGIITCYKLKRGGKKTICQITGMEFYSKDLKNIASKIGKKFACGCAQADDEIYGQCITVQGDVEYDLWDFFHSDKELKKFEIPEEKVIWEEKGQKKGRKRV